MVLPVTLIRDSGEKQLVHTLDVTETSARLGGVNMTLEPGETIDIQRGAVRAKFHVYWTGEPGTELEGQAGVRGLDSKKSIWSIQFPADEPDISLDPHYFRNGTSPRKIPDLDTAEQRSSIRYECSGGVNLRAPGSHYPCHAQLRSIHLGGFYVVTLTTLPLNTMVSVEMQVEGIAVETAGMVTASTHRVGMEIRFHKTSPETRRKVVTVLQKLKQKAWDAQPVPEVSQDRVVSSSASAPAKTASVLSSADAARALLTICRIVIADFEHWKSTCTAAEIEELRKTLAELQERLAPEVAYLTAGPRGNHGQV